MKPIIIEWERHPKDKRPAHEAQWTCYINGRINGVRERPWERQYMPGVGLRRAFQVVINSKIDISVAAMRYYVSWSG